VIELDRDLAARCARRPADVIEADVLKVDFGRWPTPPAPLRMVGNLPYNISTPILFHLLPLAARVRRPALHAAEGGGRPHGGDARHKDYGRLSVMLQWRYDIESVLDVPPESFDPPPRVTRPWCACSRCRSRPDVDPKRCCRRW
jgi:16S rRNA (adenine1518-N6/adenine1519-N6)-dimethyltransferase